MARSKDSVFPHHPRHERHVARNGQSELRYGVKKMGAGAGNWGILGDELPDVEEIARAEFETNSSGQSQYGTKLHLVDSETFEYMRSNEQAS
ncbi:hypothetical protein BD408DRAFT_358712 [Parasitella parasitica]|nr:hypothetical protein BD408DRAFT_358712 [Parasitella parasitica]